MIVPPANRRARAGRSAFHMVWTPSATRINGHESRKRSTRISFSSSHTPMKINQPPARDPSGRGVANRAMPAPMIRNGQTLHDGCHPKKARLIEEQEEPEPDDRQADEDAGHSGSPSIEKGHAHALRGTGG